ncbi:MAG TPA: tryptophan 7-halogenase [Myxococcaceae bacterium]|nr:tryptophan 7-halogenase [Myxococcaceae bacterium]
MSDPRQFDLIVLGGGPAGSTLSTLVALQGWRVLLLEKERFPRHQLGESLLPSTIHGICPLLGLKEEIHNAGFVRKRGGSFRWGTAPEPWTFTFSKFPNSPTGYAYQVERAKFDKILLDNAQRKGVDVREEHTVLDAIEENGRVVGVRYLDSNGVEHSARGRFMAETEGHRGQLFSRVGRREYSEFFQNVALYTYFLDGKRLPPPNSGNILSAAFSQGWFWYIPLSDRLTSVGAVVSREAAAKIKDGSEKAFFEYVAQCPIVKDYLGSATRVAEGMYGEFRIRKDYSYCNTKFWMPGLFLAGDAACFIDPVFSSGVHLATYSALLGARCINTLLKGAPGGPGEETCFQEFEFRYRREFGVFYQFLVMFYDMHREADSYFWEARKILHSTGATRDAFVRLVAGVSSNLEPIFSGDFFRDGTEGRFELMLANEVEGMDIPKGDFEKTELLDRFMGFKSEVAHLLVLAQLGKRRPQDVSLRAGGLVPSEDGLHWSQPTAEPA